MKQNKKCPCCKEIKPVSEFHKNKWEGDGLNGYCKICQNARITECKRV